MKDRQRNLHPLAPNQEGMWREHQVKDVGQAYSETFAIHFDGPTDIEALRQTCLDVVERHPMLRAKFVGGGGEVPGYRIRDPDPKLSEMEVVDVDADEVSAAVESFRHEPFDLENGPLVRFRLIDRDRDRRSLWIAVHHLVFDARSYERFVEEFVELYRANAKRDRPDLPELEATYEEYAADLRSLDEAWEEAETYWRDQLPETIDSAVRPGRKRRSARDLAENKLHELDLRPGDIEALKRLADDEGVSPFTVVLAVYRMLWDRYGNGESLPITIGADARTDERFSHVCGYHVNNLPLFLDVDDRRTFREVLAELAAQKRDALKHRPFPVWKVAQLADTEQDHRIHPLFQVGLNYLRFPPMEYEVEGTTMVADVPWSPHPKFDLLLEVIERGESVDVRIQYDRSLFGTEEIATIGDHLLTLLRSVLAAPDRPVHRYPLMRDQERGRVLETFQSKSSPVAADSVPDAFRDRVDMSPEFVALRDEETKRTYRDLDQQANRLANHLRDDHGLDRGSVVAVYLPRSLDYVATLLGILKAGCLYVPLDIDYPAPRVRYMLEDAEAELVVTGEEHLGSLPEQSPPLVDVDSIDPDIPKTDPGVSLSGEDPAYVMYTSGSTGQPKGVKVPHRGILRLVRNTNALEVTPQDTYLQLAPTSFDASTLEIWSPLLNGAQLAVPPPGKPTALDLRHWIETLDVTTLWLTAPLFHKIVDTDREVFQGLDHLLTGGDVVSPEHVKQALGANDDLLVTNGYGPTENTVFTTTADYPETGAVEQPLPIGEPITGTTTYVLDGRLRPLPVGVQGGLYTAGFGLAHGYRGQPRETAEAFVPCPFGEPGSRMYKTGDVVRWKADGRLVFLGREDEQVQIRGHRIEPGEIEHHLRDHPSVQKAAIAAKAGPGGHAKLVAYITTGSVDPDSGTLRSKLAHRVPEFMVPEHVVVVDRLPLTPNGKLDRESLPEPDFGRTDRRQPPETRLERRLAEVWEDVLGVEAVGRNDDFFKLGGDSILALEVVARARDYDIELHSQVIFDNPTLAEAARAADRGSHVEARQGPVTGEVPLTPIQKWFLDRDVENKNHFTQSVLLDPPSDLDAATLERILRELVHHHDLLRASFHREDETWIQELVPIEAVEVPVTRIDLSHHETGDEREAALEAWGAQRKAEFDLASPPLVRAGIARLGEGDRRVLLMAHHLVVDAVSWRIILDDLDRAYRQDERGETIELPPKTTSYRTWSNVLRDLASEPLDEEREFWTDQVQRIERRSKFPVDHPDGENAIEATDTVDLRVDHELTREILERRPWGDDTKTDEVLLGALCLAVQRFTDFDSVPVEIESHGRESLGRDLDLSRTVGWFTSIYPTSIPIVADSVGEFLATVKEQARSAPRGGIGYQLIRHLDEDQELPRLTRPIPFRFNYLGRQSGLLASAATKASWTDSADEAFPPAAEPHGDRHGLKGERETLLSVDSAVEGGTLVVLFSFATSVFEEDTVREFAQHVERALHDIVEAGRSGERGPPGRFDEAALADVGEQMTDAETVRRCSPLQEGLLYGQRREARPGLNVQQVVWRVPGPADATRLADAWRRIVERHEALRTSFRWARGQAVQVVKEDVETEIETLDWGHLPPQRWDGRLQSLLERERKRGFDVARPPLIRVHIVEGGADGLLLVWTFHHAILDGWSKEIVLEDLRRELERGGPGDEGRDRPSFERYLDWLQDQDLADARAFWRDHLAGTDPPTPLPGETNTKEDDEPAGPRCQSFTLDDETARGLLETAQEGGLTLNTLLQGAWALVLSRFAARRHVVFGATVSGRSAEVEGVEDIVGLLINTLPVHVDVDPSAELTQWLADIQRELGEIRRYSYTPLTELRALTDVPANQRLFETFLVFQNYPDRFEEAESSATDIELDRSIVETEYPLEVMVHPGEDLRVQVTYDPGRLDSRTVDDIGACFENVLAALASGLGGTVHEVDVFPDDRERELLHERGTGKGSVSPSKTLTGRFEEIAREQPEASAIESVEGTTSYGQLDDAANAIANTLIDEGVEVGDPVAVFVDREPSMVAALLGVMKAGARYVPLDPRYPNRRIKRMLETSGAQVILTTPGLGSDVPSVDATVLPWDGDVEEVEGQTRPPEIETTPDHPAYTIFTSGSTGQPKGVTCTHRGVLEYLAFLRRRFDVGKEDAVLNLASISFDPSVRDIFAPLTSGGSVVLLPPEEARDARAVLRWIDDQEVSVLLSLVPSLLRTMASIPEEEQAVDGSSVRAVMTCGEALYPSDVASLNEMFGSATVVNQYGPTECTMVAAANVVSRSAGVEGAVPVGRPVDHRRIYLLDEDLQPVPTGAEGEIYVAGPGLAHGYHREPARTAETFLPDPFSPSKEARMFRTGDLARWTSDGRLEFTGRRDNQIKVRGHRVEPEGVETRLIDHPEVETAVVTATDDSGPSVRLTAHVVPSSGDFGPDALRDYLEERIPRYMVPQHLDVRGELPRTPNGKVDRPALREREPESRRREEAERPSGPVETRLAEVWVDLLETEEVYRSDDFFELGGHSLLATRLASRIERTFDVDVSLEFIFEHPSLEVMSRGVRRLVREDVRNLSAETAKKLDEKLEPEDADD